MDKKCSGEESNWLEVEEAARCTGKKAPIVNPRRWSSAANAMAVALIMTIPPILFIFSGRLDAPAVWIKSTVAGLGARGAESSKKLDVLLGGLLLPGFDEQSCASRYQSVYYRKNMTRSPTPYLIDRLRRQEALQRRCGPGTDAYRRASDRLKSGVKGVDTVDGCSYLVLLSYRGLGNRILAAASAFLYAMLTGRVLLVDRGKTMGDLFCEPFPGTTWLLPLDFPLQGYRDLGEDAAESYGNVTLRNETGGSSEHRFVYMHLDHAASVENKLAYCDDHRQFLHRVQWVVMRTDVYIAPILFLNPAYQQELHRMFPRKDSVFYIVSRYLLHPTNDVWGMVTRFYDSYLKSADERLGIQIRVFVKDDKPVQHILDQILACTSQERLLPGVLPSAGGAPPPPAGARSKAVLVTGLNGWYHDSIREMYWRSASANGEVVSVHQPSREEHQRMFHRMQDMKALAEMYLLSMTDKIVTSGWSTFGYVGTALGGLTPYIMIKPEDEQVPDPPCRRAMSMEPCAQGPPYFECTRKEVDKLLDTGNLVPHVRACEDMSWGLKLIEPISEKDV
ncbi:galactoside 2-alpha-L-fucosyltransferase-like isoform X1 [Triticum urartu]|nr:galactoside 2-alpha-L-fucosyltransferase-like isoform X1 [Triticum urartu]